MKDSRILRQVYVASIQGKQDRKEKKRRSSRTTAAEQEIEWLKFGNLTHYINSWKRKINETGFVWFSVKGLRNWCKMFLFI